MKTKCSIDISARYGGNDAIGDQGSQAGRGQLNASISLSIPGITALYGPSGAGKTTLLRLIQGLETPLVGNITFSGMDLTRSGKLVPPESRPIATVFQDSRTLGFKTVRSCLAAARRFSQNKTSTLYNDPILGLENQNWFDLESMLDKPVDVLSGGERQRLAIYIALLKTPRLLLLDEAFSAQDHSHKQELQLYLRRLVQHHNLAILMVTHQIDDIIKMAENIIIMDNGQIKDAGSVQAILPKLGRGAFTGLADLSSLAKVVKHRQQWFIDDQEVFVTSDTGSRYDKLSNLDEGFSGSQDSGSQDSGSQDSGSKDSRSQDAMIRVRILAKDVSLSLEKPAATSIPNILNACVADLSFHPEGEFVDVTTRLSVTKNYEKEGAHKGQIILSRIGRPAFRAMNLKKGQSVWLLIKEFSV